MSLLIKPTLSNLLVDVDKDWNARGISNLKNLIIKDTDASPTGDVLLKVLDRKLKLRNAADSADVIFEAALHEYLYKGLFWHWQGETIDGFDTSYASGGSATLNSVGGYISLKSSATSGNYGDIRKAWLPRPPTPTPSWGNKRRLKALMCFRNASAQTVYIVTGDPGANYRKIGFKVENNLLKGVVADGTSEALTDTLETITAGYAFRWLEVFLDPTLATPECRFFIDGVDKGALTTNLPTGTDAANYPIAARVTTTENVEKELRIGEVWVIQEP
jgi:hypothetical protein